MKVKGLNKLYDVTIERGKVMKQNAVIVTAGNFVTGMTSVAISEKNWEKLKKV